MRTIFYSWQSDLPNNKNRGFISSCIEVVIKRCDKMEMDIIQDRDTLNIPGSPDISETIFEKINKCAFFVADISLINNSFFVKKKTPNPNVLIELGYAAKVLGWNKIVCIFNTEYGDIKELPFDLRQRRILTYSSNEWKKEGIKKNSKERISNNIYSTIVCSDSKNDSILFDGLIGMDIGIMLANKISNYNEINIFYKVNDNNKQYSLKSRAYPKNFLSNNELEHYSFKNIKVDILDSFNIKFYFNNNPDKVEVTKLMGYNSY